MCLKYENISIKSGNHILPPDTKREKREKMKNDNEKIRALNQIIAMIDSQAAVYKAERFHMPEARAFAEKKLIIDMINEAVLLAGSMEKKPADVLSDLQRLKKSL